MKKSTFRELHTYPELIKKPGEAVVFSDELKEAIKEADEIMEKEIKKAKKKNGRKFTI